MNGSHRSREARQTLEDPSREDVASWLRTAADQVKVRPTATTWAGTKTRIARERRSHAIRRAGLVATAAAAVIAVAVLGVGPLDLRHRATPADGAESAVAAAAKPPPPVPTEVPGAAGQAPIKIHLVDAPRPVPLTEGQKATLARRCVIPGESPGLTYRVFGAFQDKQGFVAVLASETQFLMCKIPTGADGSPAFESAVGDQEQQAFAYEQYLLPSTAPLTSFYYRGGGWAYARYGAGRASADVAMVLAVFPTGESVVVPVLDGGVFLARFKVEGANFPAWDQRLTFYAFDSTGKFVSRLDAWADPPGGGSGLTPERQSAMEQACLQAARQAPNGPKDLAADAALHPASLPLPAGAPGREGWIQVYVGPVTVTCTGPADASGYSAPATLKFKAFKTGLNG
ncbi:hypothetical protein I6A60_32140 [Frankia sp. AgB1.9]|uniref:hypothetical protein n=1 Tax=unclassified Frankia TaxID=2632575 RepID=UPI001932ED9C|nr:MULTISPECIES: hypothetical protein [unclassified Frankia]MBL7490592.1 hypothetical protein [Frankia sp. AgW1.1]MBL7552476.1 hypothetical protein [Frankia sp. AgB1.9]MBL7622091.1 hypothetical protein [Frankia sp. AgB1.8]